ncbi:DUF6802 family protein [Rhodococcus sp. NPDC060086]|uniref:DUF6802 family protein n=1 Tax=unclassified Rhodococcus (in: high G+C Gram-positive bacteria) TaxID=192944 RepID=UPI00364A1ACA
MADAFLGADGPGDQHLGGFDVFDPASTAAWADTVDATSDLDGDGIRDTVAFDNGHGALVVATDTDLDGVTDRLTAVADDGEFGVWEFHREPDGTPRWDRIDEGTIGIDENHKSEN